MTIIPAKARVAMMQAWPMAAMLAGAGGGRHGGASAGRSESVSALATETNNTLPSLVLPSDELQRLERSLGRAVDVWIWEGPSGLLMRVRDGCACSLDLDAVPQYMDLSQGALFWFDVPASAMLLVRTRWVILRDAHPNIAGLFLVSKVSDAQSSLLFMGARSIAQ